MGALPYSVAGTVNHNPHPVNAFDRETRASIDLRHIVAANVRHLLEAREGESGIGKLIKLGFANGTAQRVLGAHTSLGIDLLDQLARAFHIAAWQLCVPDLDKDDLPHFIPGSCSHIVFTCGETRIK